MKTPRHDLFVRSLLLFMVGAILTPFGDFAHVTSGTLGYPQSFYAFYFFGMPYWTPILFGSAALSIGLTHPYADQFLGPVPKRPGLKSWAWVIAGIASFLVQYCISGFLPWEAGGLSDVVLAFWAIGTWYALDRSQQGILLGLGTAFMGALIEILMVKGEIFFYYPPATNLFGVPSWLPWLYFAASVAVGNLGRAIAARVNHHGAS